MTIDLDKTKPMYVISDGEINEQKLANGGAGYYSWLQIYSKAYVTTQGQEKVNMATVKLEGINEDGTFDLNVQQTDVFDADFARRKWNELVSDFGWKVNSFKDKKFYHQMGNAHIDSLQRVLYGWGVTA